MKSSFLHTILFLCSAFVLNAQEIPAGGDGLVDSTKLKYSKLTKEEGMVEVVSENNSTTLIATTIKQPQFIYNLGVRIPLISKNITPEQPMLLSFQARTLESSLETAEAKISWIYKQSESSDPKDVIQRTVSLSQKWQTYYLPFKALKTSNGNDVLSMLFGFTPQKFEIKDIQLQLYPKNFDFEKLPKTKITYAGMEANAPWRVEAEKRIEAHRKGNFEIAFSVKGKKVQNTNVHLNLQKHAFSFGAAINAEDIVKDVRHFDAVQKMFTAIVFENDLKMKKWTLVKKRPIIVEAIDKLNESNIKVKGHALVWPSFRYMSENIRANKDNPEKVKELVFSHIKSITEATKGKISHWDVLNEVYTNKELQNIFGGSEDILFEAFQKLKEYDHKAERFINEYGIISGGGINKTKQDWYYNFVKTIDAKTGGLLDGVGMQSHIGSDLTPPEKVIEILNRFSDLRKKISISEFTLDILDDDIKAQYTNDYMTAAFSQPSVSEFLFWGYYEPSNPKAGLLDENFQLTKMGKAYSNLVHNKWQTNISKNTDANGKISDRGFYGTYQYDFTLDGKFYKGSFEVKPESKNQIKIAL
ncbi:endo-1,4-beta-xylanase [Flavobacterium sp. NG2]|uniref:endo-1,4-beta-xylanase n=1 Tax=Flavobacterium sp. NG2 TaxID=3097547 RepID=UPI002A838660|nr:endo-1,4-beta-xylanase [Flavobacterium sp. NG2]WPR71963.1 endo-1,4-beta-xylanase [Flavobacterium sp. NG2]